MTFFIGFNVYTSLSIKNTSREITQIEKIAEKPPGVVAADSNKKIELGEKSCPNTKAGNPDVPLKFKVFESKPVLIVLPKIKS